VKFKLGQDDFLLTKNQNVDVFCDFEQLVNAHMLILGKTGMGKTTRIRQIVSELKNLPNLRVYLFDVHGDLDLPGVSSVIFSESTDYGLNPFVVSPDPHFGGVRRSIQDFLSVVNGSHPIGARQEAVIRALLTDLFAANGFYVGKPDSWYLGETRSGYPKKFPTMDDACRYTAGKLKQLVIGGNTKSGKALEELNKVTAKLFKTSKTYAQTGGKLDPDQLEKQMELRTKALGLYKEYIENLDTGKELADFLQYDSKEVLKSVSDRFDNLKSSGIFKNNPPPFDDHNPVWRYNITALREDEKRLFVEFRLQEIFAKALSQGQIDNSQGVIRHLIVVDEAHMFFRDTSDCILNTIAKEGRKFGLGLVCASQSPEHFSNDFFSNVATKIILGVDQMYWDFLTRRLKIEPKILSYIKAFHVIGVQLSLKGDVSSRFKMVRVQQ
jgi:hypothetical protein